MDRVGDDAAGFSVTYDPFRGAVEVSGWGFWNAPVAGVLVERVSASLRGRSGPKRLVLDMSELKPMREEGQRAFAELFRALPALAVASTSVVTTSHLTKLQLMRIATENGAAAVQWLGAGADARNTG